MIPAPVYACSVHMLGAWFLVTPAGAIACPTRAIAERVRQLLDDHGMVDGELPTDLKTRHESYSTVIGAGFLTPNEARAREDLPPACPDTLEGMPW